MKPRKLQRRSLNVSSSRWMAYAVAGLATASGGAPSAEGAIHYSGLINFKFNSLESETHTFPLSQGAFLRGLRSTAATVRHSAAFAIEGAAVSNALREYRHDRFSTFLAVALPRNSVVSQGYFQRYFGRLQYYGCGFPGWREPDTHAIGFRFNSGRGKQYGWVRIKWLGCTDNQYIVKDYAWGDPGDQIKTGQTQLDEDVTQVAPSAAAQEDDAGAPADSQGSLGLLALGAVGLQAWRRSRRGDGTRHLN